MGAAFLVYRKVKRERRKRRKGGEGEKERTNERKEEKQRRERRNRIETNCRTMFLVLTVHNRIATLFLFVSRHHAFTASLQLLQATGVLEPKGVRPLPPMPSLPLQFPSSGSAIAYANSSVTATATAIRSALSSSLPFPPLPALPALGSLSLGWTPGADGVGQAMASLGGTGSSGPPLPLAAAIPSLGWGPNGELGLNDRAPEEQEELKQSGDTHEAARVDTLEEVNGMELLDIFQKKKNANVSEKRRLARSCRQKRCTLLLIVLRVCATRACDRCCTFPGVLNGLLARGLSNQFTRGCIRRPYCAVARSGGMQSLLRSMNGGRETGSGVSSSVSHLTLWLVARRGTVEKKEDGAISIFLRYPPVSSLHCPS